MLIQIEYVKIPQSPALNTYTEAKLQKLLTRFEITAIQVYFKLENAASGGGRICEIECSIPGSKVYAESSKEYFEHSVKQAIAEVAKQLEKKKAATITH